MPSVTHEDTDNGEGQPRGSDLFQNDETSTILCAFYGPNAQRYAGLLRDGIFIWQNLAALRSARVGLVEVTDLISVGEMFNNQWLSRVDTSLVLNREVRRVYPVLNLVRADGVITSNDPGGRTFTTEFDTGDVL
jgi:hypothetical protein